MAQTLRSAIPQVKIIACRACSCRTCPMRCILRGYRYIESEFRRDRNGSGRTADTMDMLQCWLYWPPTLDIIKGRVPRSRVQVLFVHPVVTSGPVSSNPQTHAFHSGAGCARSCSAHRVQGGHPNTPKHTYTHPNLTIFCIFLPRHKHSLHPSPLYSIPSSSSPSPSSLSSSPSTSTSQLPPR